jgi:hypothetical protein
MSDSALVTEEPLFNPLSPEFRNNPYPAYRLLRERDPMHNSPLGFRVATRYQDVAFVLRDKRFIKGFIESLEQRGTDPNEPIFKFLGETMLLINPPDHTRLRGLVAKVFTARRIEDMRPRIQAIVDKMLDGLEDQGRMDVIGDFAFPLPFTVICEMLGIPEDERAVLMQRSLFSGRALDPVPMSRGELDDANANIKLMQDYFLRLCAERRRNPGDDLITALVNAEDQGDVLSSDELVSNIVLLFLAGHETTVNLIGNGLLALYNNRDQLELLKSDLSLMPNAVEELLRYDSSVQLSGRTASVDMDVGGVAIKAGEQIITSLGAANRDPAVYENPDTLDITRKNIKPLSFGGGIHHCLGAQLARLEGDVALSTLLKRLPNFELDDPGNPRWRPTFTLRGLISLPAHW